MKDNKHKINEGLRNLNRGFIKEKEVEDNLKMEIAKEIDDHKKQKR